MARELVKVKETSAFSLVYMPQLHPHWPKSLPIPELGSRALFPKLQARVYANHAAISPPSRMVEDAVTHACSDFAARGTDAFGKWHHQRQSLRKALAELFRVEAESLALIESTSSGISAVALCFPWQRGDKLVLFDGDFPANVTPWLRACELFGLTPSFLSFHDLTDEEGASSLSSLENELKAGVRLVAISAVQFQTGLRVPLEEISRLCRQYGASLCVDGIQAAGVVPMAFDCVDYMVAGGHKWLMGAEGAGFLFANPRTAPRLLPRTASWLSHEEPIDFLFSGPGLMNYRKPIRSTIDFLERGSPNTYGYAALEAGIASLAFIGIDSIYRHVQAWHDELEPHLLELGFRSLRSPAHERRSGILAALPPTGMTSAEVSKVLGEHGVSTTTPDGHLRFAPHWPNSLDEIPLIREALDAAMDCLHQVST